MERTGVGDVHGGLSPVERTPTVEKEKRVRSPVPVEEGAAYDKVTTAPVSHPPVSLRG